MKWSSYKYIIGRMAFQILRPFLFFFKGMSFEFKPHVCLCDIECPNITSE